MLDEVYWVDGFIFHFNFIEGDKQSSLVEMEIKENNNNGTDQEKSLRRTTKLNLRKEKETKESYSMKVFIKTNEDPKIFFTSIHNTIKEFISKWMFFSVSDKVNFTTVRQSVQVNESSYYNDNKSFEKQLPICSICSTLTALDEKLKMCDNCTTKYFLSTTRYNFVIVDTIAMTTYGKIYFCFLIYFVFYYYFNFTIYFFKKGRVFKAIHKTTSTVIAIKERTVENEKSYQFYQREIEQLRTIEGKFF